MTQTAPPPSEPTAPPPAFEAFDLRTALHRQSVIRLEYTGLGGPGTCAEGVEKLREAARDIPVAVLRVEFGHLTYVVRSDLTPGELDAAKLVPGITAYGAAFQKRGPDGETEMYLLLASPAPLLPFRAPNWERRQVHGPRARPPRQDREFRPAPAPPILGEEIAPVRAWKGEKGGKGKRRGR